MPVGGRDAQVIRLNDGGSVFEPPARSTAILIVTTWREDGSFRATISSSSDVVSSKTLQRDFASEPEEVLAIVGRWLQSV
jgi:hypothetical protein